VKTETDKLEFHTAELTLGKATAYSDELQKEQIDTSRVFDKEQERAILHFATPFPAGSKVQLRIAFDGVLTGSMKGYYKSTYEEDNETRIYAMTQFQVRNYPSHYLLFVHLMDVCRRRQLDVLSLAGMSPH
jgi:aminopeptidase 2